MVGLHGESRMMIDSVFWAQYINVTDTQTARKPRRHSTSRTSALRRCTEIAATAARQLYTVSAEHE